MKYVVDREWLLKNLQDTRIVDCRFMLGQPDYGIGEYQNGHIPGAVFFDLEKDLSGPAGTRGGRHPLPDMDELITKLEEKGIDEKITVVAYDQGDGQYAARFWWLLRYLGHEKVFVLDGGFRAWAAANSPITADVPAYGKTKFTESLKRDWLATIEEVKEFVRIRPEQIVLIDSREPKRYLGIEEPIDKKAGHIPGAINKPWMEGFKDGRYKQPAEQNERFAGLSKDREFIVYCGSGITAVPNFIALKEAGYEKVRLYAGSFSDWISDDKNEIE